MSSTLPRPFSSIYRSLLSFHCPSLYPAFSQLSFFHLLVHSDTSPVLLLPYISTVRLHVSPSRRFTPTLLPIFLSYIFIVLLIPPVPPHLLVVPRPLASFTRHALATRPLRTPYADTTRMTRMKITYPLDIAPSFYAAFSLLSLRLPTPSSSRVGHPCTSLTSPTLALILTRCAGHTPPPASVTYTTTVPTSRLLYHSHSVRLVSYHTVPIQDVYV
ncbi:hypothetical protein R3P38DRAFT_2857648 [Favolaschia claudopus]|uniref:Uncharacterized protein n=1 Tax=Favolaschia claudopus TaxID=2862362 RepID=A0AAW0DLD9_9AGAR